MFGIPRYDLLLIIALGIQGIMLWSKLETWDEVKAITLFHLIGFALEVFKTSGAIQSWSYPDFVYANFFTHHFIGDYRWFIAALALGLYARAVVTFRPLDRDRRMPLLLAFVLIGFSIWLAENISTFFSIWSYPDQLGAWSVLHVAK